MPQAHVVKFPFRPRGHNARMGLRMMAGITSVMHLRRLSPILVLMDLSIRVFLTRILRSCNAQTFPATPSLHRNHRVYKLMWILPTIKLITVLWIRLPVNAWVRYTYSTVKRASVAMPGHKTDGTTAVQMVMHKMEWP